MTHRYHLNGETLPTIPCPHDCKIREIKKDKDYLTFYFEDDISYHESVKYYNPKAKTLIIRYHVVDTTNVYKNNRAIRRHGDLLDSVVNRFRKIKYVEEKEQNLLGIQKNNLEYLYHFVGYQSLIVELWSRGSIVLQIYADYVELEWIE